MNNHNTQPIAVDDDDIISAYIKFISEHKRNIEPRKRYVSGDEIGPLERRQRELASTDPSWFRPAKEDAISDLLSRSLGLYGFTTENIKEYLPILNASGKRCLTVASSGDHVVNLLMAGAKEIVAFDSVEAAGEVTWLKMQALADLDWEDSSHFRGMLWHKALTPTNFARLRDRAFDPAYAADRSLFKEAVENLSQKQAQHVFKQWQTTGRNAYIGDEDAFSRAKAACKQALADGRVSFVHADIRDLPLLGLGEFDVIVLSNILQARLETLISPYQISRDAEHWIGRELLDTPAALKGLIDTMIWPMAQMLNPGGVMMASYTYACDDAVRMVAEDEGEKYASDPLGSGHLRRAAFTPPPGFTVEEREWDLINGECSGFDVGVFVCRE